MLLTSSCLALLAFGYLSIIRGSDISSVSSFDHHALKLLSQDVSSQCRAGLQKYLMCQSISALYVVCGSMELLNDPGVQDFFGCASASPMQRLEVCQQRCQFLASAAVHESVNGPCSADYQAMHGFSAPLDIFTVESVNKVFNISQPMILPLPNLKGLTGPTLVKYGEPGKCAEIPTAQYCVVTGSLRMATSSLPFTFSLGNCLPSVCSENELKQQLQAVAQSSAQHLDLHIQCGLVKPRGPAQGTSKQTESFLGWGGIPVDYLNTIELTRGFWIMLSVCCIFLLLTVAGTACDWSRESKERMLQQLPAHVVSVPLTMEASALPPRGGVEGFLYHWSILRNGRSFLRTRPAEKNPFACLDAIRTISMAQVILGHMFVYCLYTAGFSNMEQFSPPYGVLASWMFQFIPGCFYGVDSFFVMSGFLCAYGLEQKVFNRPDSRSPAKFSLMYLKFVVDRYLRLTPLLMFVIAFCVNILPRIGAGILWNIEHPDGSHCFDAAGGGQGCVDYWWTLLLYIQDLDRYSGKCFGHAWYLANDFQIYLTAPFYALAYKFDRRLGWAVLIMTWVAGVLVAIVLTVQHDYVPDTIAGLASDFGSNFYFKPWCRCPAFCIGIGTSWLWQHHLAKYKGRHTTSKGRFQSYTLSIVGILLCSLAIFGRRAFYQCDFASCTNPATTPVPMIWRCVWAGFSISTWCIGLCIIMVLCFQDRFLPLLQGFLNLSWWQPFAKLSYAVYLIHTSILILNYCQRYLPVEYTFSDFVFNFVHFVVLSLLAAFVLYMFVEKPLTNLHMKVLAGSRDE